MISAEWETAATCLVTACTVQDAEHALAGVECDEGYTGPVVLALGGDSGGCFIVEGTREELLAMAKKITDKVSAVISAEM